MTRRNRLDIWDNRRVDGLAEHQMDVIKSYQIIKSFRTPTIFWEKHFIEYWEFIFKPMALEIKEEGGVWKFEKKTKLMNIFSHIHLFINSIF